LILQFSLLHIFFLLLISTKRKSCLYCPYRTASLSASLMMDFHVAKMAVELFSRQCAIAALSLIAIVYLQWMRAVYYLVAHIRPAAIGWLPLTYVHVFISNIGLHACTCIPLQQRRWAFVMQFATDVTSDTPWNIVAEYKFPDVCVKPLVALLCKETLWKIDHHDCCKTSRFFSLNKRKNREDIPQNYVNLCFFVYRFNNWFESFLSWDNLNKFICLTC